MSQTTATQMNLREFAKSIDLTLTQVARRAGIDRKAFYRRIAVGGRVVLAEAAAIANAVGCDVATIHAVLEETARRPGQRDPRGRKKKTEVA